DVRHLLRQPLHRAEAVDPFGGRHDDDFVDDWRGRDVLERPGQERPSRDERIELVHAAHSPALAGRNDDDVGVKIQSRRGWAKIIRPATVWSARVTDTSISLSMNREPPSTTIIVPSSRKPTP